MQTRTQNVGHHHHDDKNEWMNKNRLTIESKILFNLWLCYNFQWQRRQRWWWTYILHIWIVNIKSRPQKKLIIIILHIGESYIIKEYRHSVSFDQQFFFFFFFLEQQIVHQQRQQQKMEIGCMHDAVEEKNWNAKKLLSHDVDKLWYIQLSEEKNLKFISWPKK